MSTRFLTTTPATFDELVAGCRWFAEFYSALVESDSETRRDVDELVALAQDRDTDEIERETLLATIAQSLFPRIGEAEVLAASVAGWEPTTHAEVIANCELMEEESAFARKLRATMRDKGITQAALAGLMGVRQPAISMMLSRTCRPQRRTVEKLASALGVEIGELWLPRTTVGREAASNVKVTFDGATWATPGIDSAWTMHSRLELIEIPPIELELADVTTILPFRGAA